MISRYVNAATVATLQQIASERRHLRVMEVGAGIGGTSAQLIEALDGADVDYLFTDVSQFFLTEAAKRFEAQPWVRYGLFDINEDPRAQGYEPNSLRRDRVRERAAQLAARRRRARTAARAADRRAVGSCSSRPPATATRS